jgi:hypothetical protein
MGLLSEAADTFIKKLIEHSAELTGESVRHIGKKYASALLLQHEIASAINPEKLGLADLMGKEEYSNIINKYPSLRHSSFANPDTNRIALPRIGWTYPSTLPHELRHIEQFGNKEFTKNVFNLGSDQYTYIERPYTAAHTQGLSLDNVNRLRNEGLIDELGINENVGSYEDWERAYGEKHNSAEVDASLSGVATVFKANVTPELFKDPDLVNVWRKIPQKVKNRYLKTAGIAGASTIPLSQQMGLKKQPDASIFDANENGVS